MYEKSSWKSLCVGKIPRNFCVVYGMGPTKRESRRVYAMIRDVDIAENRNLWYLRNFINSAGTGVDPTWTQNGRTCAIKFTKTL